ncbi:MAG TPA: UDP-N-acetylmuramoyl-tripeptide--D-alanyl-D-alanine ligase [Solirubrobacteraceae bacterium]|nr:UDP-N-acetylmuramoyl-tripeptide--D-alanyl-D-alanine ligase [Solirubrobacteraceae bacterium]
MRRWSAQQVASAAGAQLVRDPATNGEGPEQATIDSRGDVAGALFVGLPGERVDGGAYAPAALRAGAWGAVVAPEHVEATLHGAMTGAVLVAERPLAALQRLAWAWRRELAAKVIGVTGSTGKTTTKDLLRGLLESQRRTVASRANHNTEIGLPLEILAAPPGTEVLVLEMAMRGAGQIAELARIAEPDVGVIVSIGPVHLELLGSIEAIAAAKAELIAGLEPGATAIVPAGESLLVPHLRADLRTLTFGEAGDIRFVAQSLDAVTIAAAGQRVDLEVDFTAAHLRQDLLAAVAAAVAAGVIPSGRLALELSAGRGQARALPGGVTLLDDAYNANPVSMRAALAVLAQTPSAGRRIAVLGDMLELGPAAAEHHREIGRVAADSADLLVTVGPLAAVMAEAFGGESHVTADAAAAAGRLAELVRPGDVVLVKGSNGVGLSQVCAAIGGTVAA